jgi:ComF family protein
MESGAQLVKTVRPVAAALRRAGRMALDLLYPPTCLNCGGPVASADALCAGCFVKLRPISAPYCPRLGIPFHHDLGPGALSAEAIADPPPFDRARSAVLYNEVARAIVSRMKYGDRPELAIFCARLMHRAGHELWGDDAVLVPVPLNRWRQLSRRYNQSTELARAIGRLTGIPFDPGLVRRHRNTRQQVGLTREARHRNVSGAFRPHPDFVARLGGRRVILVDDVITTGSTIAAVARALDRAGAGKVDAISFARVVVGQETTT